MRKKIKFSIKDFCSKWGQIRRRLVTFTEEILNEKLHVLCINKQGLWNTSITRSGSFVDRCSAKKLFLKISQNSQENICAGVHF